MEGSSEILAGGVTVFMGHTKRSVPFTGFGRASPCMLSATGSAGIDFSMTATEAVG